MKAKKQFLSVFLNVFLCCASAHALEIPADKYPFPTQDPYMASIFSAFSSTKREFSEWNLKYRPERKRIESVLYTPEVKIFAHVQPKTAPLMIMVPGLGSEAAAGNSLALGDIFIKQGYSFISLPSVFSWSYSISVSKEAAPGYTPRDSVEYYELIKWVLAYAQKQRGLKYSSITIVGYSYGGLLSGFLANIDSAEEKPLFKKIILINPAVDIAYGLDQLDYLHDTVGSKISPEGKHYIKGAIISNAAQIQEAKDPIKALFKFIDDHNFKDKHIKWLIGDTYRQSLANVVLGSQFIIDRGVLKEKYSKYILNSRTAESRTLNFKDYMKKIVVPSLSVEEQQTDILYASSLYSQMPKLKIDPRVFVFTNTDDFIIRKEDVDALRENFGQQRLFLFPYGGHMGNILVPFNVEMYLKVAQ